MMAGKQYYEFKCWLESGTPTTFTAGQAVIDYGNPSIDNGGHLVMKAGDAIEPGPYYGVNTSGSEPWNGNITQHIRMGNLSGFFDYAANSNLYGIVIGNEDKGYLAYDPDNGMRIQGQVVITGRGTNRAPTTFYKPIIPKKSRII